MSQQSCGAPEIYNSLSVITEYAYDAAGRLVKEGDKVYRYGYLDKVLSVNENGAETGRFDYYVDGQLAMATHDGKKENFVWDGLALIKRGTESFINEPAVTGGNPVFGSESGVMFNDMLGTTLGIKGNDFTRTNLTAFGENLDAGDKAFFTGKPLVGELGYAFLFRNYRPEQGKWQTADPLGYPDGWNNFAYVNNGVMNNIDWLGGVIIIACSDSAQKAKVKDALDKLSKTPAGNDLLNKLNNSPQTHTIKPQYFPGDTVGANPIGDPSGPRGSLVTVDLSGDGSMQDGSYTADLAAVLAHELTHSLQAQEQTLAEPDDPEGQWENEKEACKGENLYNAATNRPARVQIGNRPLPPEVWNFCE